MTPGFAARPHFQMDNQRRFKMFIRRGFLLACVLTLVTVLVACSGGSSPVTPNTEINLTGSRSVSGSGAENRVLWGFWNVTVDPGAGTVEIVPLRGAMFNANVTNFLQPPIAPVNLVKIQINPASDFTTGLIDVDVTLEHPFKSLPIFRGFDVRGIFMADGNMPVRSVPGLIRATADEARLNNADGYTRWWNAREFGPEGSLFGFQMGRLGIPIYPTSTLNPYKYFADELDETSGVETLDPLKRGTFGINPGINTRNYVIQFVMDGPNPVFMFQYAVDAAWDEPDPAFEPDYPIEAYPVSAQMQEPYHILQSDAGSTAWYTDSTDKGGELCLAVEIFDWQTPESGISDQLSALYLESPIFGGAVDVLPSAVELPGSNITSRIYSVVMGDLNLTHSGAEEVLITAESAHGSYMPDVEGGELFTYPDGPLAAFQVSYVNILGESPNNPPVAVADETNPVIGYSPLIVHLDPTGSYDPDAGDSIVLYEWDIDADGTYEYSNTDGVVFDHAFADPGNYEVQLRVTDTFDATDLLDVALAIEVLEGEDSWPMGFYDAANSCYNPYSYVTFPLQVVWEIDHPWNSQSQMVVGQDHVFQTDSNGYLKVLDFATGTLDWEKNIGSPDSYWTGCSSALWDDDVVIGGDGISSFDIATEAQNWNVYPGISFEHQGQVVVGDTIYFKGSQNSMVSIDANDGGENWSVPWTDQPLFPPVYGEVDGHGYVAAPYGYSVRCVDADDGILVWDQYIGGSNFTNPVVVGEFAYFGFYTVYKKHLQTGANDATVDLGLYAPLGIWTSEDAIYMTGRNHTPDPDLYKLYKFDFDLNEQWSVDIPYNCDVGVCSGGNVWLAGQFESSSFQLRAFDPEDGSVLYTDPTEFSAAWGGIINVNHKLFFADNYAKTACFEAE